jgi:hypothetical protein
MLYTNVNKVNIQKQGVNEMKKITDYLDKPIEIINQISDAEIAELAYGIEYFSTDFYTGDKQHANDILKALNERLDELKKKAASKTSEAQNKSYQKAAERAYAQAAQQEEWDREN